tara:strand:- start:365 stop:2008 length:1644 start_codon:yes stop_codon:yes gene_type:complete
MSPIGKISYSRVNWFNKILFLSLIIFLSCSGDKKEPNIIFFLVDDLGWSDVAIYGSSFYETPNIDQLAKDGVRFTQAYAACHVCSPTRASILTGKYPARLQLTDWLQGRSWLLPRTEYDYEKLKSAKFYQHLPFEEITIAEELKSNGYKTAIFGKWHLGEDPWTNDDWSMDALGGEPSGPLSHGFDLHIPKGWDKGWPKAGYYAPFKLDGIEDSEGDYLTDRLTDEALKFIDQNKKEPFFLYLSLFSVHDPIQGRPDLVEKYQKKLNKLSSPNNPDFILEGNPDDPTPLSKSELENLIKLPSHKDFKVLPQRTVKIKQRQDNIHFAAMVEAVDENLGRVIKKLKALDLDENTILIFFSDNGGMSGANFGRPTREISPTKLDEAFSTSNLPLRGAKGWLYEGGIRVPLIVKWPGRVERGIVSDRQVISTDFYPTILEMLGLESKSLQHVDGKSFVKALENKQYNRGAIYWHFPHYSNHGMQSPGGAIRLGDYKLIEYFENNSFQLFNLKNDISEQNDLSTSEPEKAAELLSMLNEWRRETAAQMMSEK